MIPSILIAVGLVGLLFCFARRFLLLSSSKEEKVKSKNKLSFNAEAFLAVFLVLLSGGIGGWTMVRDRDFTWNEIINEDWMQKTSSGEELYWFSVICHVLLPQRSALFAYPIVLLVFIMIFTETINHTKSSGHYFRPSVFAVCGFLTGILPLIHAHSFLAIGLILFVFALFQFPQSFDFSSRGQGRLWLAFAFPVIIAGLPQLPTYFDRILQGDSDGKGFIKLKPLWHSNPWNRAYTDDLFPFSSELNMFALWFRALGLMVPLSIAAFMLLKNKFQRQIYISFFLLFVFGNLVMLQPWEKDNNKIFIVWLFVGATGVAKLLLQLWRKNGLLKLIVIFTTISLMLSGILITAREIHLHWKYMEAEDLEFARYVRDNTDPDAIFMTSEFHIHPVTNFAGRTQLYGFPGWIHSHGYPGMWHRSVDHRSMLSSPERNRHLFKQYNVSYIAWDHQMQSENPGFDKNFFQSKTLMSYSSYFGKWILYDVRNLLKSN